jgi:ABC-2 type transport system ATP-binding protein
VGLADWAESKIEELSKGMQQKIQLVGTLLHEPDLLILDETFSGLDPINQALFKDVLSEYKASGRTVLFSTHVMEQAEKLCDHIGLIAKGTVVLAGELAAIKRQLGGRSFRVTSPGDLDGIERIAGIESVLGENGVRRILLAAEADDTEVLKSLVERFPIRGFSSEEPTLEEIFVKAVHDAE